MDTPNPERRLAAIVAADVVGYSRLMEVDEAGTLARLKPIRMELIEPAIAKCRGRVIKTNYEINFKTDLINKDPFGKGWIAEIQPSHLKDDLQKWAGDTSLLDKNGKGRLDRKSRITSGSNSDGEN